MKVLLMAVVLMSLMSVVATPALAAQDFRQSKGKSSRTSGYQDLAAEDMHQQGTWEVTLTSDFDQGFSTSVGYYVADNLATTLKASIDQTEVKVASVKDETTELSFGLGVEYNIPTDTTVVPFVGASVEYANSEEDDAGTVTKISGPLFGITGGVKVMVGTHGSVNLGLEYATGTLATTVAGVSAPDADVTSLSGFLGYSIYFR